MRKTDIIPALFIIFMILVASGIVNAPTSLNQVFAYLCLHSIGVILTMLDSDSGKRDVISVSLVIVASFVVILEYTGASMDSSQNAMFFTLFAFHNWFLIIATKLLSRYTQTASGVSTARYLAIFLNVIFSYLYQTAPSYLFLTKWWICGGLFYIPAMNPSTPDLLLSASIIAISIVLITMSLNKKPRINA